VADARLRVLAIDHVQLAMPAGKEAEARGFYAGVLGLNEVSKPPALASRGGVWFEGGAVKVHLGVDPDFRPVRKAHPAFLIDDLDDLCRVLRSAGCQIREDDGLPGQRRIYVDDPFGNRIEFLERI